LKYSRFELLMMFVGLLVVLGTAFALVKNANIVSEVIGQLLILVCLIAGLHYGRKGAVIGFLFSVAVYGVAVFTTYSSTLSAALYLFFFRTVIYAIVAFAGGELNVRLKYLFIKLEHHDYVDDITSLYNSKYLSKLIEKYISEFDRYGSKFSITNFVVDETKMSQLKKKEKQKVIKELGHSIRGNIRGADEAARVEGANFAILFPNTNYDGATCASIRVKGKIFNKLEKLGVAADEDDGVLKAEVLEYPKDKDTIETLSVNLADMPIH
jgi:diguanylate cyclase (GGDEF)-like protein